MDTADEKISRRAEVEFEFNGLRQEIERTYVADKEALEQQYHADLRQNRIDKETALRAVDLNPDGSDPQERPAG